MAAALFMTYLGVRGDMAERGLGAGNVWQYDDYDIDGQYFHARRNERIEPRCCYITSASLKDPETKGHAPEGVTNLEVMTIVDGEPRKWGVAPEHIEPWRYKRNEAYLAIKQRLQDELIERVETLFPGTRDDIVFQESATPITHTRYTRASGGTGYGLAACPEQFLDSRPGYEGPIERMFMCGASTRAGHGIVGAMLSGHHCARLVLEQAIKS